MNKRAVVGISVVNYPLHGAGNTWAFLNWALALRNLGWELWLADEIKTENRILCEGSSTPLNRLYWDALMQQWGFENHTLFDCGEPHRETHLEQFAKDATLFLNVSGQWKHSQFVSSIPHRIYLDLDPVFSQIWADRYGVDMNLDMHNHFATVGLLLDQADGRFPALGRHWIPTRPPVDIDIWKSEAEPEDSLGWSTVTHWYGYAMVEWNNQWYGAKDEEFEKLKQVPQQSGLPFTIASDLKEDQDTYQTFRSNGWSMVSSHEICRDDLSYRSFLANSRGEFSPAKNGYVISRSGWFSDRTVCYLALGKPAVLQDTGWTEMLPNEAGLLPFHDAQTACDALRTVESDYARHSQSARKLAESHFSGPIVAAQLLESCGIDPV